MVRTVIDENIRRQTSYEGIEERYAVFSTELINLDQIAQWDGGCEYNSRVALKYWLKNIY